jgi:hypothetical protein
MGTSPLIFDASVTRGTPAFATTKITSAAMAPTHSFIFAEDTIYQIEF